MARREGRKGRPDDDPPPEIRLYAEPQRLYHPETGAFLGTTGERREVRARPASPVPPPLPPAPPPEYRPGELVTVPAGRNGLYVQLEAGVEGIQVPLLRGTTEPPPSVLEWQIRERPWPCGPDGRDRVVALGTRFLEWILGRRLGWGKRERSHTCLRELECRWNKAAGCACYWAHEDVPEDGCHDEEERHLFAALELGLVLVFERRRSHGPGFDYHEERVAAGRTPGSPASRATVEAALAALLAEM